MIKKAHLQKLCIETTTNQEDFSENIIVNKRITEDQNDNSLKFQYVFEKPTIINKTIASCRNNPRRLSAFDFFRVSTNKASEKQTFSIALSYFKNEQKKSIIVRKSENLYGFSKVSSKLK